MTFSATGRSECEDVLWLSDAYVDHELSVQRRLSVLAHLGECARCWELIQRKTRWKLLLRSAVNSVPIPEALREQVRIEQESQC